MPRNHLHNFKAAAPAQPSERQEGHRGLTNCSSSMLADNMEVDNVNTDPGHDPHPDAEALRDWTLYGPRNPNIARLVQQIAKQQRMRLSAASLCIK